MRGGEKAAEKDRERSRKLQKGFKGQFSLQERLMCSGPRTRGPVLHHGSPWRVLLILPVTRRIPPRGTHTKKHTVKEAFRSIVFFLSRFKSFTPLKHKFLDVEVLN